MGLPPAWRGDGRGERGVRAARAPAKRAARPLSLRDGGKREKRKRKAVAQPLFPLALFAQGRERGVWAA